MNEPSARDRVRAVAAEARRAPATVAARRTARDHAGPLVAIAAPSSRTDAPVCPVCGVLLERDGSCSFAATEAHRPAPPLVSLPAGRRWAVVADPKWRPTTTLRRCHSAGAVVGNCPAAAVAETRRGHGWWGFCAAHLGGLWVEDGQVLRWSTAPEGVPGG